MPARPPSDPDVQLRTLSLTLDDAYRQVAGELSRNTGVVEKGKLRLERLGPAPEPPQLEMVRGEIARMIPRVDFPEVLLEIFARTGAVDCFNAGFMHGQLTGQQLSDCLAVAVACGAVATTGPGSSAAPDLVGLHEWLSRVPW